MFFREQDLTERSKDGLGGRKLLLIYYRINPFKAILHGSLFHRQAAFQFLLMQFVISIELAPHSGYVVLQIHDFMLITVRVNIESSRTRQSNRRNLNSILEVIEN